MKRNEKKIMRLTDCLATLMREICESKEIESVAFKNKVAQYKRKKAELEEAKR